MKQQNTNVPKCKSECQHVYLDGAVKLRVIDEHGEKSVDKERNTHTHTINNISCNSAFFVILFIFYLNFFPTLVYSLASFLLSLFPFLKNDLVDQGGHDKWPQKILPFEPSSNFMRHQNTIVPKSKPPHWSKGIAVHKRPLMKCAVSVWREGLFIYVEFSFIKVMHG